MAQDPQAMDPPPALDVAPEPIAAVRCYGDRGQLVALIDDLSAPTAAEWLGGRSEDFYGDAA